MTIIEYAGIRLDGSPKATAKLAERFGKMGDLLAKVASGASRTEDGGDDQADPGEASAAEPE